MFLSNTVPMWKAHLAENLQDLYYTVTILKIILKVKQKSMCRQCRTSCPAHVSPSGKETMQTWLGFIYSLSMPPDVGPVSKYLERQFKIYHYHWIESYGAYHSLALGVICHQKQSHMFGVSAQNMYPFLLGDQNDLLYGGADTLHMPLFLLGDQDDFCGALTSNICSCLCWGIRMTFVGRWHPTYVVVYVGGSGWHLLGADTQHI